MTYVKQIKFRELMERDGKKAIIRSSQPIAQSATHGKNHSKKVFTDDGIFSETIFGNAQDPKNLGRIGWIDFKGIYIINPIYYDRLASLLMKRRFEEIISYEKRINLDGKILTEQEENELNEKENANRRARHKEKNYKFKNIGLIGFRKHFLEIMQKYVTPAKKNDSESYRVVMQAYFDGLLFIDCLPVFSPALRPGQFTQSDLTFRFPRINNTYNFIIEHSNEIKDLLKEHPFEDVKLQVLDLYNKLQEDCYTLVQMIIMDNLKDKSGIFREYIAASRVNFSARNVIVPDSANRVNEVTFNYRTFANLYEELLINLIHKTKQFTYQESRIFVKKYQNVFNADLYACMIELVEKTPHGLYIILNRNPSISINSIHLMKIRTITKDINNVTLGLSNNVLAGFGADFDGDVMNIIALFSYEQALLFKDLDPRNQLISNDTGYFSGAYAPNKDTLKAMYDLVN